jgi:hypothetical protein
MHFKNVGHCCGSGISLLFVILRMAHEKCGFILGLCQTYWILDKFHIFFKLKTTGHSLPFGYIQCCRSGSGSVSQGMYPPPPPTKTDI